jgi:ribose transport system substrate-binding protein
MLVLHITAAGVLLLCSLFSSVSYGQSKDVVIAIVGKAKNDSFYQQSFKGCLKFAESHANLICIYDGPSDYKDIRSQPFIINDLIKKHVDGLIVAISNSEHLVKKSLKSVYDQGIPIITYDSDLLPAHQAYRLAYVGSNNFELGKALAEQLKSLTKKEKNTLCIQSTHKTSPNLNKRIAGIRYTLSGQSEARLTGENGWTEFSRCPLYTLGKISDSLFQLEHILKMEHPPIFLAVSGSVQFSPQYKEVVAPYKSKIISKEAMIISADTEEVQLQAIKDDLSIANIGQNPYEMGRLSAELMYNHIMNGQKPPKDTYYTGFHVCTKENANTCVTNY